ncbi:MAG: sensor histidine kinase [Candidatus Nanopelagicales bacterium]
MSAVPSAAGASRWGSMTLSRRLVIGLVTVTAVTLVVVAGATLLALRAWMFQQIDSGLMDPKAAASSGRADAGFLARQWSENGATVVQLLDGKAYPLSLGLGRDRDGDGDNAPWSSSDYETLAALPTEPGATPETVRLEATGESRAVATIAPFRVNNGQIVDVTLVAVTPVAQAQGPINRLLVVEVVAVVAAVLLVAFVGTWFVRRELRPLRRVADTASEVASLPLGRGDAVIPARVQEATASTEVGQVGLAVNAMLDHVETSLRTRAETEDKLRRFVSDAGHELRTPLASVRGYAELMRRGAAADPEAASQAAARIEAAASRMGLLVEDLLLLASLDEERPLSQDRLELGPLVAEAVAEVSATSPDHTWSADVPEPPASVEVIGDPARLHQAVTNLLANARSHTPAGTSVTAVVGRDADERGAVAWVEVRDTGPGFPEDLLPRATERFARGDYSRSRATGGSGLGLAIVKAVAEAHGGTLTVGNAPDGSGAVVRLTLPAAPGGTVEVVPPLAGTSV